MLIENLTKYRTELMGFSILWIMLSHSNIYFPGFVSPFNIIIIIGYAGVDIFFLLSGIGLAFSLSKNDLIGEFLSKRIIRVIPTFWVCLIIYTVKDLVFCQIDLTNRLFSFIGMDFLLFGNLQYWFIPSIFICYLLAPGYFSLSKKHPRWLILLLPVLLAVFLSLLLIGTPLSHLLILTVRIPIFLFGLYVGLLLVENRNISILNNLYVNGVVLLLSTFILIMIFINTDDSFRWYTGLWWYPTILMAFPLCVLLAFFFNKPYRLSAMASNFFKPFGACSLELYLIHGVFFDGLAEVVPITEWGWNVLRIPEFLVCTLFSFVCSILLNRYISKIKAWFKKKPI